MGVRFANAVSSVRRLTSIYLQHLLPLKMQLVLLWSFLFEHFYRFSSTAQNDFYKATSRLWHMWLSYRLTKKGKFYLLKTHFIQITIEHFWRRLLCRGFHTYRSIFDSRWMLISKICLIKNHLLLRIRLTLMYKQSN